MKSIAFLSNKAARDLKSCGVSIDKLTLYNSSLNVGLISSQMPDFWDNDPQFYEKVLVRKIACSLNFRDKGIVMSHRSYLDTQNHILKLEVGSEFVAEVVKIGKNVCNLKVGERVIPNCHYPSLNSSKIGGGIPTNFSSREYEVLHEMQLINIPDEISDEVAAGFTIGAQTSYGMLRRLNLNGNEQILITAASSNTSLFCLSALARYSKNITVLTSQKSILPYLKKMRLKRVVLLSDRSDITKNEALDLIIRNGEAFDIAIDPFADIFMHQVVKLLKMHGKYITCGFYHQSFDIEDKNFLVLSFLSEIITKNLTIMGNCLGETGDIQQALKDHIHGRFEVVIDSVFTGNQVLPFLKKSFAEKGRFGKVIYKFS